MGRGDSPRIDPAGVRRRVVLAGADGLSIKVSPGVLDESSRLAYTQGQCHALALALHEATGWPIIGAEDEELDVCHFFVRTPDGLLLDITGAHEPEEALQLEHMSFCPAPEYLAEQDPEWVASLGEDPEWREPDLMTARSFVSPLLRLCGAAPEHGARDTAPTQQAPGGTKG